MPDPLVFVVMLTLPALYDDCFQCRYQSNDGDCEHVHMHRCMAESHPGSKFYMMPALKLIYDLDEIELKGYNVKMAPDK